jgi:8-oxo-dGTP diphosphatase
VKQSDEHSLKNHASRITMQTIDVAAGLIFRDGKLIITQRHADAHLGGLWEFPGGKREPGESFEECLRRELREELGCDVEVLELVESITHAYPEKTVQLKFFRCSWVAHEPQAIDCAAVRWVDREELASFNFPAADAKLLDQLRRSDDLWR